MCTLPAEYATKDELREAIWELQFAGLTQRQMRERVGVPEDVFRRLRAEALVTYHPRPEQVQRLKERQSWAD